MSTETTPETDVTSLVDTYIASLNEQDDAARHKLVEQSWTPDAHYLDPLQDETGHAGVGAIAPRVEQHYPGHRFRRTTAVDAHHDQLRFGWEMVGPDGTVAIAGIDVGRLADDGRLRSIVGFFGELGGI